MKFEALQAYKEYCDEVDKTCKEMINQGFADCNKYNCVNCKCKMDFKTFYRECFLDDNRRNYAKYEINYGRIDSLYLDNIYKGTIKRKKARI